MGYTPNSSFKHSALKKLPDKGTKLHAVFMTVCRQTPVIKTLAGAPRSVA